MQLLFNGTFPHGYRRIPNAATRLSCGIRALRDSIEAQIGSDEVPVPTEAALLAIMDGLQAAGVFDHLVIVDGDGDPLDQAVDQEGNFYISQLGATLMHWGMTVNRELQLGYVLPGRAPMFEPSDSELAQVIWIYNNNAMEDDPNVRFNHYEGLHPVTPPGSSKPSLPDFEE